MTARTCQGCDLCCTVLDVDELGKQAGARCIHLDGQPGQSCAVYPDRPDSCRSFMCFWRLGFGPERFRPSDVGFVLAIRSVEPRERLKRGLITLHADPAWPDAWRTPWALQRLKAITASYNAAIAVNIPPDREASFIISPAGVIYDRVGWPKLFEDNKVRVPVLDGCGARP